MPLDDDNLTRWGRRGHCPLCGAPMTLPITTVGCTATEGRRLTACTRCDYTERESFRVAPKYHPFADLGSYRPW